jgi:excisionase family DNA binding protein
MAEPASIALRTGAEPFLSPQVIAKLTGLSYDTVRREILRGRLRGFRVGGKLRVRESDYERWAYGSPVQPAAPPAPTPVRRRMHSSRPSDRGSVAALDEIERRLTGAG